MAIKSKGKKTVNIDDDLLDFYKNTPLPKTRASAVEQVVDELKKQFGDMEKALKAVEGFKTNDPATLALRKVRQSTEPLYKILHKARTLDAVTNRTTGAVRKQKFKTAALSAAISEALKAPVAKGKKEVKKETLTDGRVRTHIMFKHDGETRDTDLFLDWLWENDILDTFGIVKFYKNNKSKRYTPKDFDDLVRILRTLNFRPAEVLEYCINKIQTKERFLEHRLYRPIEKKDNYTLQSFIFIYQKHLKKFLPFKSFYHSKDLKTWCASEDIHFKSEENCRVNKDLMVKIWNKLQPEHKVIERRKKK